MSATHSRSGAGHVEAAVDEIVGRRVEGVALRAALARAVAHTLEPVGSHQPLDELSATGDAHPESELGVDLDAAVGAAGQAVRLAECSSAVADRAIQLAP